MLFRYWENVAEANALPPIDDCYAINLTGRNEIWLSYYSAFPVVKLRHYALERAWADFPQKPTHSFSVSGERLLLVPAYSRDSPKLVLADLGAQSLQEIEAADRMVRVWNSALRSHPPQLSFCKLLRVPWSQLYQVELSQIP